LLRLSIEYLIRVRDLQLSGNALNNSGTVRSVQYLGRILQPSNRLA
jgi:hypothetical protein